MKMLLYNGLEVVKCDVGIQVASPEGTRRSAETSKSNDYGPASLHLKVDRRDIPR